ncbi:MAG: O-acetylhomoserine aminocarboxypropyltransferase/cysteine synthase [Fusobacteriaceae bacterium]|jgi:O-acetylhomoserine (thiol)-lyase|nr:O-acetylhomoserine aminocarboxypropyltransferase/cysteine synthase [Fusobacteriaceae bacterium]
MANYKFETLQLHAGQVVDPATTARAVPIYQTSSYVFNNTTHAANLFGLKELGFIYTRIGNPTNDVLEKRISALEGGVGALSLSSGSAAVTYAVLTVAQSGDEILSSKNIYGGTYNLFANTINDFGITAKFFDPGKLDEVQALITDKTKAIFIESIGNPNADILDFEKIVKISHDNGIPVIIDNTFSPFLFRPFDYGIDIIVHSATKFIGGHGTSIGGLLVDSGKFKWKDNPRFAKSFNTPDPGYHGLVYADLGEPAFILKARVKLLRDTGAIASPFNSFLFLQGIETLSLRLERHVENAIKVAKYLEKHPKVSAIHYPGLDSSPYKALREKYFPKGAGSIFTFELKGGKEAGIKFIESLKLFSLLANVGDAKSLVIHPASTTHSQLSEEELFDQGILPGTVRLSVGIEHIDDIIEDLEQALAIV